MSDDTRKQDAPSKTDTTSQQKKRVISPPPPANKMPLIAAAVALIALAGVFAIYKVKQDQTEVIEQPAVTAPAAAGTVAAPTDVSGREAQTAVAATPVAVRPTVPAVTAGPRTEPLVGDVFEGRVTGLGSQGDGRLRLEGSTVYVPGTKEGETVRYRLVRQFERFWIGEKVAADTPLTQLAKKDKPAVPAAAEIEPATDLPEGVLDGVTSTAEQVQEGTVFSVVITDHDRFNPDKNGFCRIGGFAVIVADTQPGTERVKIRITKRHERRADAVVVSD